MKRSRYTVHIEGQAVPTVILAYSIGSARRYFTERGKTVAGVEVGDYRKKILAQAAHESGGFRVNQVALKAALAELGIELPVSIRLNGRLGSQNGNHSFVGRTQRHRIMLKSYLTAEQASSTLWHELCHCMQAERAIAAGKPWAVVHAEQRRWSYSRRPIEIEARQMSERMKDRPLTIAARRTI